MTSPTRKLPEFALLLASLTFLILVYPLLREFRFAFVFVDIFIALVLLSSIFALGRSRALMMIAIGMAAPLLILRWHSLWIGKEEALVVVFCLQAVFLVYVAVIILLRVLRTSHLTIDGTLGGICVYLLLGVLWASLYGLVDVLVPGAFHVTDPETFKVEAGGMVLGDFLYFSFVTLTTLGYGDVVPVAHSAKGLAMTEAVLGPIYLAVFVARLLGLHISARTGQLQS